MTPEEFVAAVKIVVFDPAASVDGVRPHGIAPHRVLVDLSNWYDRLEATDQVRVRHIMDCSVRGNARIFAVLDGSRAIDAPPHGTLSLV